MYYRFIYLFFLVFTQQSISAEFFDHFDDSNIGNVWQIAGSATESGTIVSVAGGSSLNTINAYEGNFYCKIRDFYDSRSLGDYSLHTIGYAGFDNLIVRNDNQGGGKLAIQSYTNGSWTTLCSLSTADQMFHNIDVAFEWKRDGLLLTLDDIATSIVDAQIFVTDQNLIPANSGQIWVVANPGMTHGETWDIDYVSVGSLPGYWRGDLNQSCKVNLADFAVFAQGWLVDNSYYDLKTFIGQWLYCSVPTDSNCVLPARFANNTLYLPGDIELELQLNGSVFEGIGRVTIRDTDVRNGQNLWNVSLSNSNIVSTAVIQYPAVLFDKVNIHDDGLGADLVTLLDRGNGSYDTLIWVFRSIQDQWDGLNSSGFSYKFNFQSTQTSIHKLIENNSFSLNGVVEGCTFATQREVYNRPCSFAITLSNDTVLSPWNFPSQRVWPESRIAAEDPMDYLDNGSQTFIRYITDMNLICKNIYRNSEDTEIFCKDYYVTALTKNFTSTVMNVQLYDRSGPNAWIQARDKLHEVLFAAVNHTGYQQDPKPTVAFPYLAELPTPPNNQTLVDWAALRGISRVWVWSRWQSDWSELGGSYLSHSIWNINWASNKYDVDSLREFCQLAATKNIETILWVPGGHLSVLSPLRTSNPSWVVKKPDGQPYMYVYNDLGGNQYSKGLSDYLIDALQNRLLEVPFSGIWLDSFQVFGAESINYGDSVWTPNIAGAVDFVMRAKEELGLVVMAETGFPLAVASSGAEYSVNDTTYGIIGKEWVAYKQNKYHCYSQIDTARPNYDPISTTTYFRLLAFKSAVVLLQEEWDSLYPLCNYANKSYNNSLLYMKKCHVLDNDDGVVWFNDNRTKAVVWSFNNNAIDLGIPIVTAVDAAWGNNLSFNGSVLNIGSLKVAIVNF